MTAGAQARRPACDPPQEVEGARAGDARGEAKAARICTRAGSPRLFDMHCHLDFAPDPRKAAEAACTSGLGAFSVTVTPAGYERAVRVLASCENVRVGLGLHPWWIADGTCGEDDVSLFERLSPGARFIGEVGLDFGRARETTRAVQLAAFERVAATCAVGGKVLSIHAVKAAGEVLDVLEGARALDGNACIFHWFSGTSDELQRAARRGCLFSVNPRMLASKRGRAYAQAVPVDRLLLETDAPSAEGEPYDVAAAKDQLGRMITDLADLRRTSADELTARVASTSAKLLA